MFTTSAYSSSSHHFLAPAGLASSADEEIRAIEENEARISTPAPYLPPELIEKILYFLVNPYEPIKSILNLYATQRVNKIFYENTVNFLNNPLFNFLKIAEKDIFLLKSIKNLENDIDGMLEHENIKNNIRAYQELLQKFSHIRYQDNEIDYKWNFMLKKSKNICVNFHKNGMYGSQDILKTLSERTNIKNLSIIADSTFAIHISGFLKKFKFIVNNNKNISQVNYLSLQRSNINNTWAIERLGKALSDISITTLDLSQNSILDKYAPILAKCLQNLKIDNLHLRGIGISSSGLQHILDALPSDLKYLNLSNNHIKSHGAHILFEKLKSSQTKIECVDLSKTRLSEYPSDCEGILNEKNQPIQFIFDFDE